MKIHVNDIDVFRLLNHGKSRTEKVTNNALKNNIIPFPGFDSVLFDDGIWYVTKKKKYGNSYILYIHTLRVCAELMNHYEKTNKIEYFNKAEEIIHSWIKFSQLDEDVNNMVWYDHTTANRTQVIIQYLYLAQKLQRKINYEVISDLLHKHAETMMNDKKYKYNNHGLMMDRSLMILGNILEDERYMDKGKSRALNTFWYSFSPQGVHLENSPQYHNMVVRMYTDIERYLNKKNNSLGEIIKEYLKLAEMYKSYILKPDKRLASIGDSDSEPQRIKKIYKNVFDKEAGIAIMQYNAAKPFFMTFVCGYSSKVHKHQDDLSITLNYNKYDFFVDPGKYSYTKNKTRKYITSKTAHSSFYMDDFDYTIKDSNRFTRKVALENFYENEQFTLVNGINKDYDGNSAKLKRYVIQFNEQPLFILVDNLETDETNSLKITQKFNLASNLKVEYDKCVRLTVNDATLTIKQFNETSDFKIIDGDEELPIAVNSSGFAKVEPTKQLCYKRETSQKNAFLTAVFDEKYIRDLKIELEETTLKVNFNNKAHYIYI